MTPRRETHPWDRWRRSALRSVGAAWLTMVALILVMVGVPAEGIGLILGVDRFLDMCRTTLNVTGDLAAAVVVSGERLKSLSTEQQRRAVHQRAGLFQERFVAREQRQPRVAVALIRS